MQLISEDVNILRLTPFKLPVSVTMVAKDEAGNLPKSLGSVRDWVEEMILVLNDCTDDTEKVAKELGATVYIHDWHGHRDQKNIALRYAEQPWILALDADEVISDELRHSIMQFIENNDPTINGASFARRTRFMGRWIRHGDWYPDRKLRLIRKGSGKWGGVSEHDKMNVTGKTISLEGDLLHYSFRDSPDHLYRQPVYAEEFYKRQKESGARWSCLHTVIRPAWRFFRAYFLRLGFLDGYPGFYIASATAFFTLFKYTRLYEFEQEKNSRENGEP